MLARVVKPNYGSDAVARRSEDEKWIPQTSSCETRPGSPRF